MAQRAITQGRYCECVPIESGCSASFCVKLAIIDSAAAATAALTNRDAVVVVTDADQPDADDDKDDDVDEDDEDAAEEVEEDAEVVAVANAVAAAARTQAPTRRHTRVAQCARARSVC